MGISNHTQTRLGQKDTLHYNREDNHRPRPLYSVEFRKSILSALDPSMPLGVSISPN